MKIKICGLTRETDIAAVNAAMPDYVGFVFFEKSRRYVTSEQAHELKLRLNPAIRTVGVFVDEQPLKVMELIKNHVIDVVQLHGSETIDYMGKIKEACKKAGHNRISIIKAISMTEPEYEEKIQNWEMSDVDFLLLDSGTGGTGQQFDYGTFQRIGKIGKPIFLAGGLKLGNVAEAVAETERVMATVNIPLYAVDLSSGVETEGKKDAVKIKAAVDVVHKLLV